MMKLLKKATYKVYEFLQLKKYSKYMSGDHIEYLGSDYGGWAFCPENIDSQSVIYSMGIGEDVSWDEALIKNRNVTVHGFDPTPKAIEFVKNKNIDQFILHPIGVASANGMVEFFPPKNTNHVSYSLVEKNNNSNKPIKVKVETVDSIMKELSHKNIDILKMDIEGAEYEVVPDMLYKNIYPRQILIEFHHRFYPFTLDDTLDIINKLISCSYKISSISDNKQEFSFIKSN